MNLVKIKNTYCLKNITEIQLLRIYKALEATSYYSSCIEIDLMVACLKQDMSLYTNKGR